MVVPSARTPYSEQGGRAKIEERDGLVSIDSRARKSVMRGRRGADAENIHHARGDLSRPVDLRFIITFSPAPRGDRVDRTVARPYLEIRSVAHLEIATVRIQLNGKMRRT